MIPALDKDSCGVGFIADIKGRKSHKIVEDALTILLNLEHRGAVGADPRAGDGAGILVQIPHKFFARKAAELGFTLPPPGEYAVGYLFMPRDPEWRQAIRNVYEEITVREGLRVLGWREVPTDNSTLGKSVKPTEPVHLQVFIGQGEQKLSEDDFERRLYVVRKVDLERDLHSPRAAPVRLLPGVDLMPDHHLQGHVPRRPARHLLPRPARAGLRKRARARAPALLDQYLPGLVARASLPHDRAQRRDQHAARQQQLDGGAAGFGFVGPLFGDDIHKLWPISYEGQSDTACFDNALEFLVQGGYPLAHAMMMMIPEAWAGNPLMDEERRAFYEYNAALMEPWDGPAAIAFTNGRQIGATLDRNGLAPRALLRHARRPHHHGVRDGRAAGPGEGHRHQVAAAARQDAAGRSRRGPAHSRRGAQVDARPQPPLQANGSSAPRSCWKSCRPRRRGLRCRTLRCSIANRPSATPRKTCGC